MILIKCRACGCKVAGREPILSRQRAACLAPNEMSRAVRAASAVLQTWAQLPGGVGGTDRFQLEGRRHTAEPPAPPRQQTHNTPNRHRRDEERDDFVAEACTDKIRSLADCIPMKQTKAVIWVSKKNTTKTGLNLKESISNQFKCYLFGHKSQPKLPQGF